MENERKSNSLLPVVIILAILVLCLGGYIIYDKLLSKPTEEPIAVEDNTSNVSQELYNYKLDDDLNTEFKIYQIGEVYIATSTMLMKQCNTSDTLIFNSDGEKLKEYKYAYVQIDNDIISINYSTDGTCLSSGENLVEVKYQVVGSNLIEQ